MELKRSKSEAENGEDLKTKVKKGNYKKVALLVGYAGFGYHGVQIQNDTPFKTIEADLFNALLLSEAVRKENAGDTKKMKFQRCSRTDKDVSAVRQVFSLKMRHDSSVIEDINKHLPENIKAFGFIRVTKKFNSKKSCDSRTYEYFIPSYVFSSSIQETNTNYRITENIKNTINEIIPKFKGTHNFYNFTSKRSVDDKSLNRFIIDFKINDIFIHKNIEFISFLIQGQSFMFHQIRKIIGYIVAVIRKLISEDDQNQVFTNRRITIPVAPGLGLILDNVHFSQYNKRFINDPSHSKIEWSQYDDGVQNFKKEKIVKYILDTEVEQNVSLQWINKCMSYEETVSCDDEPNNIE